MFDDLWIQSRSDLEEAIRTYGFLPFFTNSIEGFSLEEHIDGDCWYHSGTGAWEAWDWKGPVIRDTGCAYGKFFEKKACFISPEWYPDFANCRRDGYDFDARWDDGLASAQDRRLYELIDAHAPILSKELKYLGDYRKGGQKGFDTVITRLQAQGYVLISDFVYLTDRHGNAYGWGVAEYSTPERFMGAAFTDTVYRRSPEESRARITDHLMRLFPHEDPRRIMRFVR